MTQVEREPTDIKFAKREKPEVELPERRPKEITEDDIIAVDEPDAYKKPPRPEPDRRESVIQVESGKAEVG